MDWMYSYLCLISILVVVSVFVSFCLYYAINTITKLLVCVSDELCMGNDNTRSIAHSITRTKEQIDRIDENSTYTYNITTRRIVHRKPNKQLCTYGNRKKMIRL